MYRKTQTNTARRERRHKRVRAVVRGTASVPRLAVFRSNKYVYAQLIDDDAGTTLAVADSRNVSGKSELERAKAVGAAVATSAAAKKISRVVFDRGGFLYAGKVKAVADGAREGGLAF